jgi:hypothetical protein
MRESAVCGTPLTADEAAGSEGPGLACDSTSLHAITLTAKSSLSRALLETGGARAQRSWRKWSNSYICVRGGRRVCVCAV